MNNATAAKTYNAGDRFITHAAADGKAIVFIIRTVTGTSRVVYRVNVRHACGTEFEGNRPFTHERVTALVESGTWEKVN